ncbi:MAG: D-amino acid dehydrogenase [Betaproteobacteria bacterium]|jgi:D-amino-acid dehydrogenase|nr:D-amino acid dehydrogenase [Rhodocyclaceae bacterium]MCA3133866.1 D-amino acid dehydrogenase [Rhodocyclaceae bacterium]MCA3143356.1 D-amino acid dehydrogenase [Rhodocyclaceae bacterium]MCA3147238.1 D-amino acid dehydrogenase [Rhodocyclaceae bacterium]MCE2898436.1 D-amino acid dehydrogenase [Betaproteobacteria bacterium]
MRVLVLGSGVVGTTAAWYLNKAGHEVTVVDRQPASGLETSFANGGQISVSHAEPWANPHAPATILKWIAREDAPLLFRLRAEPAQWSWGLRFLFECLPGRTQDNIVQLVNLGLYSRAALQALRAETGIRYEHLERGILHFYTSQAEFEAAAAPAELMRQHGVDRQFKTAAECVAIEPALAFARDPIAGGTYTPSDESGNAWMFTEALSKLAAARGVVFHYGTDVLRLLAAGGRLEGVRVRRPEGGEELLRADAYVMALGSYSTQLLRGAGIRVAVYPAKGYSITVPVAQAERAPSVSLTDDAHKLVFSRLADQLRVAGTAELAGWNTEINRVRCQAIVRRAAALFPGGAHWAQARFWAGLRPATPGNVPLIGRSRLANLFLNTGHGTLGWTHACGSGKALADLVSGRVPEVDFRFLGVERPRTLKPQAA